MSGARLPVRALTLVLLSTPGACVYLNAVYNAKRTFNAAEEARWAGRDSLLHQSYAEVVDKAMRAYGSDPEGKWADDALFLAGRAHLRRGELGQARAVLTSAAETTSDTLLERRARLYLGAVEIADGEVEDGLRILDAVLAEVPDRRTRGEGYLWRARAQLQLGRIEEGWADLDRAERLDKRYGIPADLERLIWGVRYNDVDRTFQGVQALLERSEARSFGDSLGFLVGRAAEEWGPAVAVYLLAGAEHARWSREARDGLLMRRAQWAFAADDTARALTDALRVGGGVGPFADSARLTVAGWRLEWATQIGDLADVRAVLLPAVASAHAREILNAMRRVEALVDHALAGEPIGFFAAAERARDVLRAGRLAEGLFRAYADRDGSAPWAGKALLAARQLARDGRDISVIEARLDALPENAYVRYARRGVDDGSLARAEADLQELLDRLVEQVEAELVQRRLFIADPETADTLATPPPGGAEGTNE